MDQFIFGAFAVLVAWFIGVQNRGWPGPIALIRGRADEPDDTDDDTTPDIDDTDTTNRRSRPMSGREHDTAADVVSGPLRTPARFPWPSPRDIEGHPPEPPGPKVEERHEWVARQLAAGLLTATEIDREGAEKYGCSPKTIERERKAIRDRQATARRIAKVQRSRRT